MSRREEILIRLLDIMEEQTGFNTKKRNVGLQDNDKRDSVILLDGDETQETILGQPGRGTLMRPQIMRMSPELYILLKETRPQNDTPQQVGTMLNTYRDAIISAIASDTALATSLGSNGSVIYNGCATDLKSGSALSGTMRLDFAFLYPLIPSEL